MNGDELPMQPPGSFIMSAAQSSALRIPKSYLWTPQPDITAFELAQLLPHMLNIRYTYLEDFLAERPDLARHWTEDAK